MKRWGKTLKSMLMAFWKYIAKATFSRINPTTNIFNQICNNGCLLQFITIFLLLSLPVISLLISYARLMSNYVQSLNQNKDMNATHKYYVFC